ncbi:hypothetical protein GPROT1_00995 [Gammaproteobacteria bacterium]|nr:hypothetical protein GPROT1_00995 [Gammaproteobacteria bacterium]
MISNSNLTMMQKKKVKMNSSNVPTQTMPPNTPCSRPAQLPKLGVSFDGCRLCWWRRLCYNQFDIVS